MDRQPAGVWLADTGEVTDAMRYFYRKTGVQSYPLICGNLDGKGGALGNRVLH